MLALREDIAKGEQHPVIHQVAGFSLVRHKCAPPNFAGHASFAAQYVHYRHFDQALTVVQPQLLPADLAAWQSWPQQPGMQSGFASTD
jgi:hypothetical protein